MVHAQDTRIRVQGLQPAQVLAAVAGLVFLAVGIVGLAKTGLANFTGHHPAWFWQFAGNPLMSVVRVVTGIVGLLLAFGSGRARLFGWLLVIGYGALFVWGLMLTGWVAVNPVSALGNPMDLGAHDTLLHLGVAVYGLLVAVLPARRHIVVYEEPATADADQTAVIERDDRARDKERGPGITREERPPGLAH